MKPVLTRLCALLILSLPLSGVAAKMDELLIARWTFNKESLASDIGDFRFVPMEHGANPEYSFTKGAVRLGSGCLLVCDEINSTKLEALGTSVTIWARMKVEQPFTGIGFSMGLRNRETPADWAATILTTMHQPAGDHPAGFIAHLGDGSEIGSGSGKIGIEPGEFVTIALVFNGNTGEVRSVVNGHAISKHTSAKNLAAFTNFSLGRLKETGGNATLHFDEVRIYWGALPIEWINEITPVTGN